MISWKPLKSQGKVFRLLDISGIANAANFIRRQ